MRLWQQLDLVVTDTSMCLMGLCDTSRRLVATSALVEFCEISEPDTAALHPI